jgi:type II secretory pathway component GspD/PulD (secretin)
MSYLTRMFVASCALLAGLSPTAAAPPLSSPPTTTYALAAGKVDPVPAQKVSLLLNDLTLAEAYRFLLEGTGLSLVGGDSLEIQARGFLDDVTLPQALEILADRHDLACRVDGTRYVVDRHVARTLPVNQVIDSEQFRWEELKENLAQLVSPEGRFTVNTRSGLVSILDSPSAVSRVEEFLTRLEDDLRRQIHIEAKIVEMQIGSETELGVDWTAFAHGWDNITGGTPSGGILEQRTASGGGVFKIGLVHSDRADLLIDMLEQQGRLEVISRPRIATMGNEPAIFKVTETIPYFTVEVIPTEGQSPYIQYEVDFKEAGIVLEVVAHVGADDEITLQVHPQVSEVTGYTASLEGLPPQPIIDLRETSTRVRMRHGETLVISGLILTREERAERGVPVISRLPLLGRLFRHTRTTEQKLELMILLTPRILRHSFTELVESGNHALWLDLPWPGSDLRSTLAAHEHNRAVEAFRSGDARGAVRHARLALAASPELSLERLNLALYLTHVGNLREARQELRHVALHAASVDLEPLARNNLLALDVLTGEATEDEDPTLTRAIAERGGPLAQAAHSLNRAARLEQQGLAEEAANVLTATIAQLPPAATDARRLVDRQLARIERELGLNAE